MKDTKRYLVFGVGGDRDGEEVGCYDDLGDAINAAIDNNKEYELGCTVLDQVTGDYPVY